MQQLWIHRKHKSNQCMDNAEQAAVDIDQPDSLVAPEYHQNDDDSVQNDQCN